MDYGKSVTYIFKDKNWFSKLIVGWLINLVPILNFAFTGYVTQTLRNVELGHEEPLPMWDDFGKKFMLGLYVWLAGIVYALPLILLSTIFIIPAALVGDSNSSAIENLFAGTMIVFTCASVLYALGLSFFMPAANINLARKGTLGSVFQIGEFFRIFRANTGDYLMAWLMTIVWAVVIGAIVGVIALLTSWIICIGWVITFVVGALAGVAIPLVYAHLFGQVAGRQSVAP